VKLNTTTENGDDGDDIRKFLAGGRVPIFKFKNVGDQIKGALAELPKLLPLTEFNSTEPKLDADGNPEMQLLLVLTVGEGRQRVYIDKPLLREALWGALKDAGVDELAIGGIIEIVRIDDVKCQNGGFAHNFYIVYSPPQDDSEPVF
jgi:hypothetical protein